MILKRTASVAKAVWDAPLTLLPPYIKQHSTARLGSRCLTFFGLPFWLCVGTSYLAQSAGNQGLADVAQAAGATFFVGGLVGAACETVAIARHLPEFFEDMNTLGR